MHVVGEAVVDDRIGRSTENEDLRLVRSILKGDHTAFDRLVQEHSLQVTSIVRRTLRDPNELEDAVQETFLRAYRSLERFRGQAALRTWLIQIAINVCRDRHRTFWMRRVVTAIHPRSEQAPRSGPDRFEPGANFRHVVEMAVGALPEQLRLPFALHAFEELSGAEIARVLGWSESTVWTRIYAARKRLQKELAHLQEG